MLATTTVVFCRTYAWPRRPGRVQVVRRALRIPGLLRVEGGKRLRVPEVSSQLVFVRRLTPIKMSRMVENTR
jgi:hypothetical protein